MPTRTTAARSGPRTTAQLTKAERAKVARLEQRQHNAAVAADALAMLRDSLAPGDVSRPSVNRMLREAQYIGHSLKRQRSAIHGIPCDCTGCRRHADR